MQVPLELQEKYRRQAAESKRRKDEEWRLKAEDLAENLIDRLVELYNEGTIDSDPSEDTLTTAIIKTFAEEITRVRRELHKLANPGVTYGGYEGDRYAR